jgi:hypothetical protein
LIELKKNWFSIFELSSIWNCQVTDILHFGQSNQLEICFDWKIFNEKLRSKYFFGCLACFIEGEEFFFGPMGYKRFKVIEEVSFKEQQLWQLQRLCTIEELEEIKDYEFVPYEPVEHSETSLFTRFVAINSELLFNSGTDQIVLPYSNDLTAPWRLGFLGDFDFCIFTSKSTDFNKSPPFQLNIDDLIVTKMEKERFESNLGNKESKSQTLTNLFIPNENRTKWLIILGEAINTHFSKDRARDPKKNVVVEWIKAEAVKNGINPSDNIANAIFTIIKPEDHNPKKKRG